MELKFCICLVPAGDCECDMLLSACAESPMLYGGMYATSNWASVSVGNV
jgi:hypothetical protein